jgi:menaquinol-cytochrome c reductase iron-sulfur subunit
MQGFNRRSVLGLAIQGMGALMGGALGIPALRYLFSANTTQNNQLIEIADLSKIPAGEPAEVVFRRKRVDGWKTVVEKTSAWVIKRGEADVIALAPGCTHLGCAFRWEKEKKEFLCPCHTSTFTADGQVTAGPAPRPLDRYVTEIRNGKLLVGGVVESKG